MACCPALGFLTALAFSLILLSNLLLLPGTFRARARAAVPASSPAGAVLNVTPILPPIDPAAAAEAQDDVA